MRIRILGEGVVGDFRERHKLRSSNEEMTRIFEKRRYYYFKKIRFKGNKGRKGDILGEERRRCDLKEGETLEEGKKGGDGRENLGKKGGIRGRERRIGF